MQTDASSPFRAPEAATTDLSPAAVARYRILAEQERNKAVARLFRRVFARRSGSVTDVGQAPLPAE